jgi:hypothetical protein
MPPPLTLSLLLACSYRSDLVRMLYAILGSERAELLCMRFGLDIRSEYYGAGLSIKDIARTVDMKQDKVRRVLKQSLRTIQPYINEDWLHA